MSMRDIGFACMWVHMYMLCTDMCMWNMYDIVIDTITLDSQNRPQHLSKLEALKFTLLGFKV